MRSKIPNYPFLSGSFWFSGVEREDLRVHQYIQVPGYIRRERYHREQRGSAAQEPRALCGVQPLQHSGHYEHAGTGTLVRLAVESLFYHGDFY